MDTQKPLDERVTEYMFRRFYHLDQPHTGRASDQVAKVETLPTSAKAILVANDAPWTTAVELARLAKAPKPQLDWVTKQVVVCSEPEAVRNIVERHLENLKHIGLLESE